MFYLNIFEWNDRCLGFQVLISNAGKIFLFRLIFFMTSNLKCNIRSGSSFFLAWLANLQLRSKEKEEEEALATRTFKIICQKSKQGHNTLTWRDEQTSSNNLLKKRSCIKLVWHYNSIAKFVFSLKYI